MMVQKEEEEQQKKSVVCEDCDKSTQKDLPETDTTSGSGQPCESQYSKVASCMSQHSGQISACADEWKAFRQCHEDKKVKR